MRSIVLVLGVSSAVLALPRPASAQAPQAPPRMAASSYATVEVHLNARNIGGQWYQEDAGLSGPSRIAISYGQPHARGRRIEGGLVPLDTVWRFGANMATALHSDVDLTVGDLKVPRGDYSLFVLYSRAGWLLIVNRGTGEWGLDRDSTKDVGPRPAGEPDHGRARRDAERLPCPGVGAAGHGLREPQGHAQDQVGHDGVEHRLARGLIGRLGR